MVGGRFERVNLGRAAPRRPQITDGQARAGLEKPMQKRTREPRRCRLVAALAYTPGTGFAWMDAWTLVGLCN